MAVIVWCQFTQTDTLLVSVYITCNLKQYISVYIDWQSPHTRDFCGLLVICVVCTHAEILLLYSPAVLVGCSQANYIFGWNNWTCTFASYMSSSATNCPRMSHTVTHLPVTICMPN